MCPCPKDKPISLAELKTIAQLREVVAEEVEAKANVAQAEALAQQIKWMKWMAIGTFLMALTTALMAVLQYIK